MPFDLGNPESIAALNTAKETCKALDSLLLATEHAGDWLLDNTTDAESWDGQPLDAARDATQHAIESLFVGMCTLGKAHGFTVRFNRLTASYEVRETDSDGNVL